MALISPSHHRITGGKTVTIRSAIAKDAEALLKMTNSVLSEQVFTLTEPEELAFSSEQEAEWIEKMNAHESHLLIIAETEGEIVGILDFTSGHRKRIAHTGDFGMSVSKAFREKGIGSLLLNALIAWASAHPTIEKINLKVHANNPRAIHVYEKFGFVQEGRLKNDLKYGETEYVDTVVMGKLIP